MNNKPILQLKDIDAGYNAKAVIRNINLTVYENDFLGIIGPNGGGKTTLVKLMLGLLKPIKGDVVYLYDNLKQEMGYMPQINNIDKKFPILVREVLDSGLSSDNKLSKSEKKSFIDETLSMMGIVELADKPIGELSGGQLQRTLLGRAMINKPQLLILDEPNSYVDKQFETHFYELLQKLNDKTAIVLVSHDIGTVVSNVKNIACVNETIHYHSGSDINSDWVEEHFGCPFEIIGHGDIPHRILRKH